MRKAKTRAQDIGVNAKSLERRALKKIAQIEKAAIEIAGIYGDIDQGVCSAVDRFREVALGDLRDNIKFSTEYLNEVPE